MLANPLHQARVMGGIRLSEVAARTCLSPRIVRLIDSGEFDRLPGGLYARSMHVRAFADVVGLNPESAVRELSERLPPDEDPIRLCEKARAAICRRGSPRFRNGTSARKPRSPPG